jgi:transposase
LYWIGDEAWAVIEPLLPANRRGRRRVDDRRVLSGIVHALQSGCRWRDCPPDYGPYMTIYCRLSRWHRDHLWHKLAGALAEAGCAEAAVFHSLHTASRGGAGRQDRLRRLSFDAGAAADAG